jgi:hypothetical protein
MFIYIYIYMKGPEIFDYIKPLILLSVIGLSSGYCTFFLKLHLAFSVTLIKKNSKTDVIALGSIFL